MERLSWDGIVANYPDKWVALSNVKYMDDDGTNIEMADVVAVMTDDEHEGKRIEWWDEGYDFIRTTSAYTTVIGGMIC